MKQITYLAFAYEFVSLQPYLFQSLKPHNLLSNVSPRDVMEIWKFASSFPSTFKPGKTLQGECARYLRHSPRAVLQEGLPSDYTDIVKEIKDTLLMIDEVHLITWSFGVIHDDKFEPDTLPQKMATFFKEHRSYQGNPKRAQLLTFFQKLQDYPGGSDNGVWSLLVAGLLVKRKERKQQAATVTNRILADLK